MRPTTPAGARRSTRSEANSSTAIIFTATAPPTISACPRWRSRPARSGTSTRWSARAQTEEARELFDGLIESRNPLGLLSEDIDPVTKELWGNFPQTYSMVGIINGATRLSRRWDNVL